LLFLTGLLNKSNFTRKENMFATLKKHCNIRASFALVLVLTFLGLVVFSPAPSYGQVLCNNIDTSSTAWPSGQWSQECITPPESFPAGASSIPPTLNGLNAPNYNVSIHWAPDAFARLSGSSQTGAGDTLSITVYDPNLPNGSETVNYTTVPNDTTTSAAARLAAAIEADANLQSIGEYAYSSGFVVDLRHITGDTYSETVTPGDPFSAAGETITLAQDPTYSYLEDATITSTLSSSPYFTYYIFPNPNDFWNLQNPLLNYDTNNDVSFQSEQLPSASAWGFTPDPANQYNWTAIFTADQNGVTIYSVPNVVVHESGHELDFLYASQGILTPTDGSPFASNSQLFQNELATDWYFLNNSSPCTHMLGGSSPQPYPGIFSYLKDAAGNQICSQGNPSPYAGYNVYIGGAGPGDGTTLNSKNTAPNSGLTYAQICTNAGGPPNGTNQTTCGQAVLQAAYPNIFDGNDTAHESHEIFAELVATITNYSETVDNQDSFLGGGNATDPLGNPIGWAPTCALNLETKLIQTGVAPTSVGAGGYTRSTPPILVECPSHQVISTW
jgi:hypothetical protein